MIRNEYYTGSDGSTSLPIFINLIQYNDNVHVPNYDYDHNIWTGSSIGNIVTRSSGTLGGSSSNGATTIDPQFQFTFDCVHEIVENLADMSDPFAFINDALKTSEFPKFSKEQLLMRYIILNVPDVGQEAKSLGYRDFVPQVWYRGKKLWQIYVGLIRNYTSKTAYILIPRTGTNLSDLNGSASAEDFYIRCAWKNNIEDLVGDHDITLSLRKDSTPVASTEWIPMYWKDDHYEMKTEIPSFVGLDFLDWYDVYFVKDDKTLEPLQNAPSFFTMDLTRDELVRKQDDYYREAFFREYFWKDDNPEKDYLGQTQAVVVKAYLKKEDTKNITLKLRPRASTYECYYCKGTTALAKLPFTIRRDSDFFIFDKDGKRITASLVDGELSLASSGTDYQYEIVPEYSPSKRYEYSFSGKAGTEIGPDLAKRILFSNDITPWNIETPEILVFSDSGDIVEAQTLPDSGKIRIYADYDLGDDEIPTAITGFTPTQEFYETPNDSYYHSHVSVDLAGEPGASVTSSVFPILTEDYTDPEHINEQSKVLKNEEIKLHRVLGAGSKEYLFLDNVNDSQDRIAELDTFRSNLQDLLAADADKLEVSIDKDLDNLKAALWSLFCSTADLGNTNLIYNTLNLNLETQTGYDTGAWMRLDPTDSKVSGTEYIIIPCDPSTTASYVSRLKKEANKDYLTLESTSLVKAVEYDADRWALVYITPSPAAFDGYLYIPNWKSYGENNAYTLKRALD